MYVRKTRDRWDIEVNYGYGWDYETSEYTYKEAKQQLNCYRENVSCPVRIVKRREKIVSDNWKNEVAARMIFGESFDSAMQSAFL